MLFRAITQQAALTPDKIALVHNEAAWTYAAFATRLQQARAALVARQLGPGGVVVLALRHLAQAWVQGIAARSLGFVTVCPPSAGELDRAAVPDLAAVITTASETSAALLQLAATACCPLLTIEALGKPPSTTTLPELGDEAGHILMTSGTTGRPKLLLRDPAAELAGLALQRRINAIEADSVLCVGEFPLSTAGGWRWPLMAWSVGATVIFQQSRPPQRVLREWPISHYFATPLTLANLVGAPAEELPTCAQMRLLVTGGRLPAVLASAAQRQLGAAVFTFFAASETLTVAVTPVRSAADLNSHAVHPLREVQIVDALDRSLPAGQVGLLRIRLRDGLDHYLGDVAASRQCFRDGYFYPGDLGCLQADGRLQLHGRVSEVLNALGEKIPAGPIEQRLQDQLGVTAVCVLVIADDAGLEAAHVAIEAADALEPALLQQAIAAELAGLFRHIHHHRLSALPRNPMGKVDRARLQQLLIAARVGADPH